MMKINGLSLELIIPPGETIKELLKDNKMYFIHFIFQDTVKLMRPTKISKKKLNLK